MKQTDVIAWVAKRYRVRPRELTGPKACRTLTLPRMVAWRLIRKYLELSYPRIGRTFRRKHSTVLSGLNHLNDLRERDRLLKASIVVLDADFVRYMAEFETQQTEQEISNNGVKHQ